MTDTRIENFTYDIHNFQIHFRDGKIANIDYLSFLRCFSGSNGFSIEILLAQIQFLQENPSISLEEWNESNREDSTFEGVYDYFDQILERNDQKQNEIDFQHHLENGLTIHICDRSDHLYELEILFTNNHLSYKIFHLISHFQKGLSFFDRFHPDTYHQEDKITLPSGIEILTKNDDITVRLPNLDDHHYYSMTGALLAIQGLIETPVFNGNEIPYALEILAWYHSYRLLKYNFSPESLQNCFRNNVRNLLRISESGMGNINAKFAHAIDSGLIFVRLEQLENGNDAVKIFVPLCGENHLISVIEAEDLFQKIFLRDLHLEHYIYRTTDLKNCFACFENKTNFLQMEKCPMKGCSTCDYCFDCFKKFNFRCMICREKF